MAPLPRRVERGGAVPDKVMGRLRRGGNRCEVVRLRWAEYEVDAEPQCLGERVERDRRDHHQRRTAQKRQRPRRVRPPHEQQHGEREREHDFRDNEVQRVGAQPVVVLLVAAALEAQPARPAAAVDRESGAHDAPATAPGAAQARGAGDQHDRRGTLSDRHTLLLRVGTGASVRALPGWSRSAPAVLPVHR